MTNTKTYRVVKSGPGISGKWFDSGRGVTFPSLADADEYAAEFAAEQASLNLSPVIISVRTGRGSGRRTLVEYKLEDVPTVVRRVDWMESR